MSAKFDYAEKFEAFKNKTLFQKLERKEQIFIKNMAFAYKFSFQDFRKIVEASRDLEMWKEPPLAVWWPESVTTDQHDKMEKKQILADLTAHMRQLRLSEKSYNKTMKPLTRKVNRIISRSTDKKIFGKCPVASEKTVCCNLYTIDAVQNCVFGCSYCTIQTFYQEQIIFEEEVQDKLNKIILDPSRFYHFGTGQASDSLAWGNRFGILDAHCQFAEQNPNVLMEFKTKSKNIEYFTQRKIPPNVVCSWSLNPDVIIKNEEHFTAILSERLAAAHEVSERGVKLAFHFHPMVYYSGWQKDYGELAAKVMSMFDSDQVLFISFGSVTLIKPVIQRIRDLGNPSKILQMNFETDPHGKYTYPDDLKKQMFKFIFEMFKPWQTRVFFYLCMEKASIWLDSLGYVYHNNREFEAEFAKQTMHKISSKNSIIDLLPSTA